MRGMSRRLAVVGIAAAVIVASASAAFAAITSPTGNPFVVSGDSAGNPQPFTITANGFTPGVPVYVEECDGKTPNVGTWNVNIDCDNGRSTPGNVADGSGNVTFAVGGDFQFTPFKGESPSTLFNCLSPHGAPIGNGLQNWTNCQLRVSSNNASHTGDESLPADPVAGRAERHDHDHDGPHRTDPDPARYLYRKQCRCRHQERRHRCRSRQHRDERQDQRQVDD